MTGQALTYIQKRALTSTAPKALKNTARAVLRATPQRVKLSDFNMVALTPVWVPYVEGNEALVAQRKNRRSRACGPNGEPPESGDWKLQLPNGTIYDGPKISASALDTASECMHKWALARLDDLEKPTSHRAELGHACHEELEAWLKFAKQPTTDGMMKVAEHFPMPGEIESEVYFGFMFGRPGHEVVFAGYLDGRVSVLSEPRYHVSSDEEGNDVVTVVPPPLRSTVHDLKTTGDFRWKKTPAQLRANVQAAIYALGEMLRVEQAVLISGEHGDGPYVDEYGEDDFVNLRWTYAHLKEQKGGKCKIGRVETVCDESFGGSSANPELTRGVMMTRQQAVAVLAQYLPLAEKLVEAIKAGKKAADMPKNHEACAGYGGCPWKKLEIEIEIKNEEKLVGITKRMACEVPKGGGFLARLHQERERLGIETTKKTLALVGKVDDTQSDTNTSTNAIDNTNTRRAKMGLGARFGNKNGTTTAPAASAKPAAAPAASAKPAATAPAASAKPAATAKPGSMAGRFSGATAAAKTDAPPKTEQKAVANGMASSGTGAAPAKSGSLVSRLAAVAGGAANGAAIEKAASNAPAHEVSENVATEQLATGIQAPDAAPEMTQEQLDAEAERIAGEKANAAATTTTTEEKPKGRGGRKAAAAASAAPAVAAGGAMDPATAVAQLDQIALGLMAAGHRAAASAVMGVSAQLSAA